MIETQVSPIPTLPDDTVRVAHSPLREGNLFRIVGDQLELLVSDIDTGRLGAPTDSLPPTMLALITVFQYLEGLSDPQAVAAARRRIDWKYALHLPLNFAGFDHLTLLEFRETLCHDESRREVFDQLLARLHENDLLGFNGNASRKPVSAMTVLDSVRTLNRLILVMRTMCLTIEALSAADTDFLDAVQRPYWRERYGLAPSGYRPPQDPEKREALALAIGADGFHLIDRLPASAHADTLRGLPEVELLRHVWRWQFDRNTGAVRWRTSRRTAAEHLEEPSAAIM